MEVWKFKKNSKRIIFCNITTFFIITLTYRIIGAEVMENLVPLHIMKIMMNNFSPEIIIDGEIAYDVLMWDGLIFYGTIVFLITFYYTFISPANRKLATTFRGQKSPTAVGYRLEDSGYLRPFHVNGKLEMRGRKEF